MPHRRHEQGDSGRPRLPAQTTSNLLYSKANTDMVSYEDLLIAQYLEELRKAKGEMKKSRDVPTSPYVQKLPHSDYGYITKRRPASATSSSRPPSGHSHKPKIDAKFIADPTLWDPATPRSSVHRKGRPESAPVRQRSGRSRPLSGTSSISWLYGRRGYSAMRPVSALTGRRIKSQYKKQPTTIRVTAFKNGSRENFIRVAAPTVKIFLEMCTDKLGLPFAARRIFLEDGVEVTDPRDIPLDGEVFVSTGENYKDPYKNIKRNMIISQGAKWTLSGVLIPEDGHIRTRTSKMSKRMKALTEKRRIRIIVYRNGMSTEPVEVVADLNKLDDFLVSCTGKLDLRSHAKVVYDWEGNEITHLTQTPVLDDCLQPGGTAILGPVWVSVGESFSATATLHYIRSIKQVLTDRLKDAERYKTEINYAMQGQKETISITAILSMSEEELYTTFELAEKEISQLKVTLSSLKSKIAAIEEVKIKEETEGANYRMSHIQEFSFDHKLVGRKGLRLKVFENGFYGEGQQFFFNIADALKGTGSDKSGRKRQLQRLLDDLSTNRVFSNPVNPKLTPVARRIFDKYGNEINDILKLEYDQEIWVSFGEPFVTPFLYCLQATFDRAKGYDLGDVNGISREANLESLEHFKSHRDFEAHASYPSEAYEKMRDPVMIQHIKDDLIPTSELSQASHYIQAKKDKSIVLYPEAVITQKVKKDKSLWPMEAQVWVISKRGYIYNKGMPNLCLAVSDTRVEFNISEKEGTSSGFVINMQKATSGNIYQQWKFNPDATISNQAHPDLVVTYTGHKMGDEEAYVPIEGVSSGVRVYLVLMDKLTSKKEASFQRFALKQERFDNLGQWKFNEASNQEWNKQAYSWPAREDGSLNEDYDWPMEGYIIPNAPPLHKSSGKNNLSGMTPLRLMCLKNGEQDLRKAIPVVGPNLTNFLDHCTSLLDMPFAARRLFDQHGNEHFSLTRLKRDDIVYVSCGEAWSDPKLTKAEQQRRFLLSQLSQDVAKIRQYCALRNPENYVLEVEGNLVSGNPIIVNQQWRSGMDDQDDDDKFDTKSRSSKASKAHSKASNARSSKAGSDAASNVTDNELRTSLDFGAQSAHEIAHERSEQRLNQLKWPWERLVNVDNGNLDDDPEANKYTDREMYERYKPAPTPKVSRDTLQRFVFEDGYIACQSNRNLVLGVQEQEGRISQVTLVKRRPDDIHQRFIMRENGEIRSKHGQRTVLTVSLPANEPFSEDEEGRTLTYSGCAVTIQQRKTNMYGKSHQRWHYDAETGHIHAFKTNRYDKEITAANKADVCTYSIAQETEIDQPGYVAEVPMATPTDRQHIKEIRVCTSCARAMRGRYKLQKIRENTEFSCAMGEAKKLKLQQIGSFRVLNGKVDLSEHEAELTLENWEDTLTKLREETSVRTIAKEISVAKTPITMKIMAYKNGEGRLHQGKLICGSSIEGILGQCTYKLGMANAAQKIFTEDGTMVLEIDDLKDWAINNYTSLMADQLQKIMAGSDGQERKMEEENEDETQQPPQRTIENKQPEPIQEEEEEDEIKTITLRTKIQSGINYTYTKLSDHNYELGQDKHFMFEVRACNDAHIALMEEDSDEKDKKMYEVVIGTNNNAKSAIRNKKEGVNRVEYDGRILDGGSFKKFLITWEEGEISLYKELNEEWQTVMSWKDPSPFNINYIGVSTSILASGVWRVEYSENKTRQQERGEGEGQDSPSGGALYTETAEGDQQESDKVNRERQKLLNQVTVPSEDVILRYPIEVWVSSGKEFIPPEKVESKMESQVKKRAFRSTVSLELDIEKHILRNMRARRMEDRSPGKYRSTRSSQQPVVIEGHWQDVTVEEQMKHDTVHKLETHLAEVKNNQKEKKKPLVNISGRLYRQPNTKRVLVYPNGESVERATYVWGDTIEQVLDSAKLRLGMWQPAKYLYNMEGRLIVDFDEINRDELLCVSGGKPFVRPLSSLDGVEIKANWARARKEYGPQGTDFVVEAQPNPKVYVDPYGPPELAMPLEGDNKNSAPVQSK
ncbi:doublecortin domain-containing protein 1-like [Ylistrum balloti]|uniref:doublecortin domain-containing protein 1-like n=1 Tax=Ylistrum balloti TaxID=509963 RepID=UPI002905CD2F|nr:doublecortin domain-containing protein 1-like [Ylistrum balloti]